MLWLFASPGPVMQWLTGQVLFDVDASKIKSLHNIWLCIRAAVRPVQYNLKYWTSSRVLCSNHEQNRNKIGEIKFRKNKKHCLFKYVIRYLILL